MTWDLTLGQVRDDPERRRLIDALGNVHADAEVAATTRELAQRLGFVPIVPPHPRRSQPWELDKARYRRRNEVERLFRRLKAW